MRHSNIHSYSSVHVTSREEEVLQHLSQGLTSKQIGAQLHISSLTVDKHKKNLLDKFQAKSSAQLIYLSIRQGHLPLEWRDSFL